MHSSVNSCSSQFKGLFEAAQDRPAPRQIGADHFARDARHHLAEARALDLAGLAALAPRRIAPAGGGAKFQFVIGNNPPRPVRTNISGPRSPTITGAPKSARPPRAIITKSFGGENGRKKEVRRPGIAGLNASESNEVLYG